MQTLYIESEAIKHSRTQEIIKKFPQARIIEIDRFSDVFNRKNQDFRQQKKQLNTLILAKKHGDFFHEVPSSFALETKHNYYFSHLYNCPYDCEYCFLQGMYRSAQFVMFVNFEDFQSAIKQKIKDCHGESVTFFSGYDNDSLAMEPVTHFAQEFIPWFSQFENAFMELRTKSAHTKVFENLTPSPNIICAFTLSPEIIQKKWEARTAPLKARIEAIKKLQSRGWNIGIRIEPVIRCQDWEKHYGDLFDTIESEIDCTKIANIYFGQFRLPKDFFKKMHKMHPQSTLFTKYYELRDNGEISYSKDQTEEMFEFIMKRSQKIIENNKIYSSCS